MAPKTVHSDKAEKLKDSVGALSTDQSLSDVQKGGISQAILDLYRGLGGDNVNLGKPAYASYNASSTQLDVHVHIG